MPTNIKLGRDQVLTLDGVILEGVRELEVDIDAKTFEVTSYEHPWASTLTLTRDITVKLLVYWQSNYDAFAAKFYSDVPTPMSLGISNVGSVRCMPVKVSIKQPISGVMAWEVTLKSHWYT